MALESDPALDGPPAETDLLRAALEHFGEGAPPFVVESLPIDAGVSQVAVHRLELRLLEREPLRVVLKPCPLVERRVLSLVDGLGAVPRVFVDDVVTDGTRTVVMADAGEALLGFDDRAKRMAAESLAEVHLRFLGRFDELGALPRLTSEYVRDFIVDWCWRRHWSRAVEQGAFRAEFGHWIAPVEASAATLPEDLLRFSDRTLLDTLAHTDIYYGHVFEQGGRALIIDWGQARRASLFVDLGDTFDTVEAAGIYRQVLADRGLVIDDAVFAEGHLLARRFAGIRYLWWWLDAWTVDARDWNRSGLERMLAMAAGAVAG